MRLTPWKLGPRSGLGDGGVIGTSGDLGGGQFWGVAVTEKVLLRPPAEFWLKLPPEFCIANVDVQVVCTMEIEKACMTVQGAE
jgi:hypothetical protein